MTPPCDPPRLSVRRLALICAAAVCLGCAPTPETPWSWTLPDYLEPPPDPAENPTTVEKVELGRALFFDERLSGNGTQSCASCHQQDRGFSDGLVLPEGSTGATIPRNAMALANLGWFSSYTWANPRLDTLELQALVPLVGDTPPELHAGSDLDRVLDDLRADPLIGPGLPAAFPDSEDPFNLARIADVLSAYERTMVSLDSPYDRWRQGDDSALSAEALRGMELFESDDLACAQCHGGPLQSNATVTDDRDAVFFNTGLYAVYPADARGLYEFTVTDGDFGRFRVPSLRNIAQSAPYFHDGSGETLDDVLDHYARGGRLLTEGPGAGDGRDNPDRHDRIGGFALDASDRVALLAFLEALSDPTFLSDPDVGDPGGG